MDDLQRVSSSSNGHTPKHTHTNTNHHNDYARHKCESHTFELCFFIFQVFVIVIFGIWIEYDTNKDDEQLSNTTNIQPFYLYFNNVSIMIFFGFGFLMSFLRRYAYSATGYCLLISALVVQWSIPIWGVVQALTNHTNVTDYIYHVGISALIQGLFCAAAVMISFGAILGKVTPTQLLFVGIVEPILYFLNLYIGTILVKGFDSGGGLFIHTFGAYYGLSLCCFVTNQHTLSSTDNTSSYSTDLTAIAGTIFLWIMWPSFNAALLPLGDPQLRALINTFLSLTGSTISAFIFSRFFAHTKFDMVHIQNSTLAGGVIMGVVAAWDISIAGAISCGFVAGAISVIGYVFISPFLCRKLNLQDVCGVHNLHGIPGVLGAIVSIFASIRVSHRSNKYGIAEFALIFPAGPHQATRQTATLFITIGIAVIGGLLTGVFMKIIGKLNHFHPGDWFNDSLFWEIPSDYYLVQSREADVTEFSKKGKERQLELQNPQIPNLESANYGSPTS